jgi:membrane protease YdiL (CAAX protease family)
MISTYVLIAIILGLMYFKDLVKEFKIFVDNYDDFISPMLKYYLVGIGCMIFFNLILSSTIGSISANEEGVREMLFKAPLLSMAIIAILAPFEEEITFRKSFQPLINNKWLYSIHFRPYGTE